MKRCPECAAEYEEQVAFCARDGRALLPAETANVRLCPHCANGIDPEAAHCPYCKADLGAAAAPEWLIGDERPTESRAGVHRRIDAPKVLLGAGIILCLLAAGLFALGILGRDASSAARALLEQKIQELQAKEEQISALEAELHKLRAEAAALAKAETELKAQLAESQKELKASAQRLETAKVEIARSSRQAVSQPETKLRTVGRTPPAVPQASVRPGVYETARSTELYERPARSARVITRIAAGTRINVAGGEGEWLEVVSKRGNPPGYVLRTDARPADPSR